MTKPAKTKVEKCKTCKQPVKTMAFRGSGFCSVDCKKKAGIDTPSVGTIMFVSTEERDEIMKKREKSNG